jgi:hypothetical protein
MYECRLVSYLVFSVTADAILSLISRLLQRNFTPAAHSSYVQALGLETRIIAHNLLMDHTAAILYSASSMITTTSPVVISQQACQALYISRAAGDHPLVMLVAVVVAPGPA